MVISPIAHRLINLCHVSSRWKQTQHSAERYGNVNFRFEFLIILSWLQFTVRTWHLDRSTGTARLKPANEMIAASFNFLFNDFSAFSLCGFSLDFFSSLFCTFTCSRWLFAAACYATRTWSHVTNAKYTNMDSKWLVRKTIAFCCQLRRGQWCNKWLIENVQLMSNGR